MRARTASTVSTVPKMAVSAASVSSKIEFGIHDEETVFEIACAETCLLYVHVIPSDPKRTGARASHNDNTHAGQAARLCYG